MLKSDSPVTLYQQISDDITTRIENGEYKEGQLLPSEARFCEIYQVSRVTVRNAISDLVEKNLVIRRHGKGTFVAKKKLASSLFHFEGFTTACRRNNVNIRTHILLAERQKVTLQDMRLLHLSETSTVVYLVRLRFANDIPVIIEHVRLPFDKYGFLLGIDLENRSLYATLAEYTGANPEDYCNTSIILEASAATTEEAKLLQIRKGMPLFVLKETVSSSETQEPIHWTKQIMSGGYFRFYMSNTANQLGLNLHDKETTQSLISIPSTKS